MKKILILLMVFTSFASQAYAELPTWKHLTLLLLKETSPKDIKSYVSSYSYIFENDEWVKCYENEFYARKKKPELIKKIESLANKDMDLNYSFITKASLGNYDFDKQRFSLRINDFLKQRVSLGFASKYNYLPSTYYLKCEDKYRDRFDYLVLKEKEAEDLINKYPSKEFYVLVEYTILRFGNVQTERLPSAVVERADFYTVPTKVKIYSDKDLVKLLFIIKPNGSVNREAMKDELAHKPNNKKRWTDPTTGMEFVWIPSGCFEMGSRQFKVEQPVHKVCVDGFWMGKYEVTNAQYRSFKPHHKSLSDPVVGESLDGANQPVVRVTWKNAKEYADWLTSKGNGRFRLPTEAEWEYAARAGSTSKRYWGNSDSNICDYANVNDTSFARSDEQMLFLFPCNDGYAGTAPVGQFPPNKFGLYDMMGNVYELCEDVASNKAYSKHSRKNPVYKGEGGGHIVRGGSCFVPPKFKPIRSSHRAGIKDKDSHSDKGFRLVRVD